MQSLDSLGRVIYMNTFSKTLAPSIRISYMVLPGQLMEQFQKKLGFYSCTVPSFEQYTLARFLSRGYFEKHINRMRKFYKSLRNRVLTVIQSCPIAQRLTILEEDAGLHFLVRVDSALTDQALVEQCEQLGLRIRSLGSYFHGEVPPESDRTLVINYSGLSEEDLEKLTGLLSSVF